MEYIRAEANGQLFLEPQTKEHLRIPSFLYGFKNEETTTETAQSGRTVFCFRGRLAVEEEDRVCKCGKRMHINAHPDIVLRHLCFGGNLSCVLFPHNQFKCPACGATKSQFISFKAIGHRMTEELYQYTRDLLAIGTYTNKQVAEITGLGKNTVKSIDKKRLQELYTIDGKELIKPEKTTKILGIDEFKLHNGRKYATHIIDMETGHILWIANGKCPHIQPVFDHFHLVKNFNDKVVSEVRKDEQRRLYEAGDIEAAKALKKTRYILMSKRSTLQKKDQEAEAGRVIHRGSPLFGTANVVRKSGYEEKYDSLLRENALLFTLDDEAYRDTDEARMAEKIIDIMDICEATGNSHLLWFRKLLDEHFEGIIAHATFQITSGKVEGINQKIKTLRRHGYGYPDDEYFFLKLFDASRRTYDRNTKSHRFCD